MKAFYVAVSFNPDSTKMIFGFVDSKDLIPIPILKIVKYPEFDDGQIVGPVGAIGAEWSPNGNEILFLKNITNTEPQNNIFVMDSDGDNIKQIIDNKSKDFYHMARWSPDGEKIIVLVIKTDGTEKSTLYTVNKDRTNLHKLLEDDSITFCDWSK